MPQVARRGSGAVALPREVVALGGFGAAVVLVVASGAGLASLLPGHPSIWLSAGAYGAPAAAAFAVYWWIAQKL